MGLFSRPPPRTRARAAPPRPPTPKPAAQPKPTPLSTARDGRALCSRCGGEIWRDRATQQIVDELGSTRCPGGRRMPDGSRGPHEQEASTAANLQCALCGEEVWRDGVGRLVGKDDSTTCPNGRPTSTHAHGQHEAQPANR